MADLLDTFQYNSSRDIDSFREINSDFNSRLLLDDDKLTIEGLNLEAERSTKDTDIWEYGVNKDNDFNSLNILNSFPRYSVNNYFEDLDNWRKQLNPFVSKGHFYFKIFFNFDTNYGLLGGIFNSNRNTNTAYGYLSLCEQMNLYSSELLSSRKEALQDFVMSLAHISTKTPWFFKTVNGLNNIKGSYVNNDDFGEKSIEIECMEDSIDMRLGTLFDLYKFACYNTIKNKEIIPANLRKFEMQIIFCHIPYKKFQEKFTTKSGVEFKDKEIDFDNKGDIMSFKLLTFQNCEFDVNSLNEFNDAPTNENLFNLGKNQIKINYDRVYETRLNEYEHLIIGQNGLYDFTTENGVRDRFDKIAADIDNDYQTYYIEAHDKYGRGNQNLFENHTKIKSKYYQEKLKYSKQGGIKKGNIYNYDFIRTIENGERINTKYFEEKLRRLHEGTIGGNLYDYDYMRSYYNGFRLNTPYLEYKLKELKTGTLKGNIYAYNYSTFIKNGKKVNTAYLEEKLRRLSKGTINGNLYDYNFGPSSRYFDKKLNRISEGTINGNLYDYDFGLINLNGQKFKSDYFNEKLARIKNGSLNNTLSDIPLSFAFENEFKEYNISKYDEDIPWKFEIPRDMADLNEFNETLQYKEIDEDLAHVNLFVKNNITNIQKIPKSNQFKENNIKTKELDYSLAKPNTFTLDWHANGMMNSNNIFATDGADIKSNTWVGKLLEGTVKRSLAGLGF